MGPSWWLETRSSHTYIWHSCPTLQKITRRCMNSRGNHWVGGVIVDSLGTNPAFHNFFTATASAIHLPLSFSSIPTFSGLAIIIGATSASVSYSPGLKSPGLLMILGPYKGARCDGSWMLENDSARILRFSGSGCDATSVIRYSRHIWSIGLRKGCRSSCCCGRFLYWNSGESRSSFGGMVMSKERKRVRRKWVSWMESSKWSGWVDSRQIGIASGRSAALIFSTFSFSPFVNSLTRSSHVLRVSSTRMTSSMNSLVMSILAGLRPSGGNKEQLNLCRFHSCFWHLLFCMKRESPK